MPEPFMTVPQKIPNDTALGAPVIIPAVELRGSPGERLRTIDASIARLQKLRRTLIGDPASDAHPYELHGPYLHAPVWPWFVAGWVIGALFVLMFVFARVLA
jgi:hypothetical protein